MPDEHVEQVIEQITLRKLEHCRQLLKRSDRPHSGNREKLRFRLAEAVDDGAITVAELQSTLNELDAWGDQRVRIGRLPPDRLRPFRDRASVEARITASGLADLVNGDLALFPPRELAPMRIEYTEAGNARMLVLTAAKTRLIDRPQKDIPDKTDPRYPGVVFKPYKREVQKAIAFAEIDLDTGTSLVSTTLLRQGGGYTAEFGELYVVFKDLIDLRAALAVNLFNATLAIRGLPQNEVTIIGRNSRTNAGGTIQFRSHHRKVDMRQDQEMAQSDAALPAIPGFQCNCRWQPANGLAVEVHTHIFAPEGEISFLGQLTESDVRHVLRRIVQIN